MADMNVIDLDRFVGSNVMDTNDVMIFVKNLDCKCDACETWFIYDRLPGGLCPKCGQPVAILRQA